MTNLQFRFRHLIKGRILITTTLYKNMETLLDEFDQLQETDLTFLDFLETKGFHRIKF